MNGDEVQAQGTNVPRTRQGRIRRVDWFTVGSMARGTAFHTIRGGQMVRCDEAMSRTIRTVIAVLVATIVLVSCGGTKTTATPRTADGDGDTSSEPVHGGTVVYGIAAENSDGWCLPQAQLAPPGIQVARSIYDTLTVPNQDGDPVPFLARSLTPNDDYTEWSLELREGVRFHDGTDLDATVVKNNLDAYRGKYPTRMPLLFRFVFDNIADVEVTGPLSLRITTVTSWSSLPQVLWSSGRVGMMAQSQLDDPETCDSKMVGTGPFKLVEWSKNQKLVLERNPDYWMTDDEGRQLPYLDSIEYRPVVQASTRGNGVLAGDLDMTNSISPQDYEVIQDAVDAGQLNIERSEAFAQPSFLQLNIAKAPFDNKNARMALITALDMETFNETTALGLARIANGPFAPGNIGYLEDTGYPKYDPAAAKSYAAAYRAETGRDLSFSIIGPTDPEIIAAMALIQDMAKKVGITITINQMEIAAMVSTAVAGDYEAMAFANFPGGDPDDKRVWWYGGSPVNLSRFNDPEINRLLDEGRATADKDARQQIYGDINRRFASEGYMVWLNWSTSSVVTAADIHGIYGPTLPNGDEPSPSLVLGHSMAGVWRDR